MTSAKAGENETWRWDISWQQHRKPAKAAAAMPSVTEAAWQRRQNMAAWRKYQLANDGEEIAAEGHLSEGKTKA